MYDIPVLEPYSGYIHLSWEQREVLERTGFIKFYEKPDTPHLPISRHDNTQEIDIKIVTFEKVRAGKGYVVKVTSGNPNKIPTWKEVL